jgi:adenylate cyclase
MSETRKIAAILVSDIVGYSRLAGADEDRILARLRALRSDLIDPTIAVHHGRVVKRTGDGNLLEFRSVVDAVRCAVEVQTAMVERNAGVPPERRIEFRVGIHLGDVVEESDGDLMGDGVNIAARLEGICQPGGVCLSEDAYRQVRGRLDLAITDLGQTQLKNIAETIRVYSLQVGVPAEAKAPKAHKRSLLPPLVAAIGAFIVIGAAAWYIVVANKPMSVALSAPPTTEAAGLSVVVLPFANLSGNSEQDYLADALTDEVTTSLARIPNSFVIARNTANTFKGKAVDAKALGKDLSVRYVLEGSVQSSGAQMRVNAQLIDAESGAHIWAEQFDTPRADLLQMQDEIVTHLARELELHLTEIEAVRLKRTPASNPAAEDLALQCEAGVHKGGYIGKEADAAFRLCEQALAADPNNARALAHLAIKFFLPVELGISADPKADLQRADDLVSKALVIDPNYDHAHVAKANILAMQGRPNEAIAEDERTLALDPAMVDAVEHLGWQYWELGQFKKGLEYFDKALRISPHDPFLGVFYSGNAIAYFGLKQYDEAIEWGRRSIAINPNNNPIAHGALIAALALTGHEVEAKAALQRYVLLDTPTVKTIAAWKAYIALTAKPESDPRYLELWDRIIEGLRKAGLPEDDKPRLSIVVLPFANLSGDAAQDYLADALTDELTTGLARIRDSFVIARNTAYTYKGKPVDAKAIGKDLGVRYVLEGSVQPAGAQVRVNAQLIDADSGAHLWAEQFDTARADLLQTQDEIVAHLARAMDIQLRYVEAARLKRTPAANPDAEDLALQCQAGVQKGGYIGKEADAGYRLCEQALAADPNNALALTMLSIKFWLPVAQGRSADPKADLKRADELNAHALAVDPNLAGAHAEMGNILGTEGRRDEAIAENERALALDPAMVDGYSNLGFDYLNLGQFEKSLEFLDKAIRLSPHDPNPGYWSGGKAEDYFALKQYDQAVEWAHRSIAIDSNNPFVHGVLVAALAFTGHEAEAREALQRYLAIPSVGPRTIAAWTAFKAQLTNEHSDSRYLEYWDRMIEGLRKAGMLEV